MAFTPTAGGTWDDARGQTYRFDIGTSDIASGTYYRHQGSKQWMTYEDFWKDVKRLQTRVNDYIKLESETLAKPKPPTPIDQQGDWDWNMKPAAVTLGTQQTSAANNVTNTVARTLTDSIPRPKTAQATPSPVSRFKMKKTKGRFTIGI